jgi:general secretion pathway protein G
MNRQQGGYTLLELMAGIMILGFLSAMAVAAYDQYIERARVARAISDIGKIHLEIQKFLTNERRGYPASLADLGLDDLIDPWGNPYQYLVVDGLGNNGAVRKDKNLIPVNRSYDVYSMGKDGNTASPFTSTVGQDDVVLAGDGTYFGLAADF